MGDGELYAQLGNLPAEFLVAPVGGLQPPDQRGV